MDVARRRSGFEDVAVDEPMFLTGDERAARVCTSRWSIPSRRGHLPKVAVRRGAGGGGIATLALTVDYVAITGARDDPLVIFLFVYRAPSHSRISPSTASLPPGPPPPPIRLLFL